MKKNVAILGLSSFGIFLCRKLVELGVDVMVVDLNEERVSSVAEIVKRAVVADATDKESLNKLGLQEMDHVVVCMGEKLDASILIALFLEELGVKEVLVKALDESHEKILRKLGVKHTVIPERDVAERIAHTIQTPNMLDFLPLGEGYSVIELSVPKQWVGSQLGELHILKNWHVQVFMLRAADTEEYHFPRGDSLLEEGEILVLGGRDEDLERIGKLK